jgi:uncharacterized protein YndB with AHSA1/START domain
MEIITKMNQLSVIINIFLSILSLNPVLEFNLYAQSMTYSDTSNTVYNKSFIASNGERFLRYEITLEQPIQTVWDAFTIEKEITTWMVAIAKLDLRIGGSMRTAYSLDARLEDPGTTVLSIPSYIPLEMLIYRFELGNNNEFPEKCRNEDENMQEILQFQSLGENKTKIVSTMVGWGTGEEWDIVYGHFEEWQQWTFEWLVKRFKEGPKKWK